MGDEGRVMVNWRRRKPPKDTRLVRACEACGARPGERCANVDGNPVQPHPERYQDAENGVPEML